MNNKHNPLFCGIVNHLFEYEHLKSLTYSCSPSLLEIWWALVYLPLVLNLHYMWHLNMAIIYIFMNVGLTCLMCCGDGDEKSKLLPRNMHNWQVSSYVPQCLTLKRMWTKSYWNNVKDDNVMRLHKCMWNIKGPLGLEPKKTTTMLLTIFGSTYFMHEIIILSSPIKW